MAITYPDHAILVHLLVDMSGEGNGAHDTVPEFLVQNRLVRITIVLYNLVETIDQRFLGRHLHALSSVWETPHLCLKCGMVDSKVVGEILDIFWGGLGLSIEQGSCGDLVSANLFGDGLKGHLLLRFRLEQGNGGGGQVIVLRHLIMLVVIPALLHWWHTYIQRRKRHVGSWSTRKQRNRPEGAQRRLRSLSRSCGRETLERTQTRRHVGRRIKGNTNSQPPTNYRGDVHLATAIFVFSSSWAMGRAMCPRIIHHGLVLPGIDRRLRRHRPCPGVGGIDLLNQVGRAGDGQLEETSR